MPGFCFGVFAFALELFCLRLLFFDGPGFLLWTFGFLVWEAFGREKNG
jgi:hypothetical protein